MELVVKHIVPITLVIQFSTVTSRTRNFSIDEGQPPLRRTEWQGSCPILTKRKKILRQNFTRHR